jgi:hypothetical protein
MEGLAILLLVDSVRTFEKGSRGESSLCAPRVLGRRRQPSEAKSRGADTGSPRFGNYAPFIRSPHSSNFLSASPQPRIVLLVWPEKTSGDAHTTAQDSPQGGCKQSKTR